VADRIAWAIEHRQELYEMQRLSCASVIGRSWATVSEEYLALLEKVALSDGVGAGQREDPRVSSGMAPNGVRERVE
jgi:hypothetical protein